MTPCTIKAIRLLLLLLLWAFDIRLSPVPVCLVQPHGRRGASVAATRRP